MLTSLHVKNMALIREAEVEFGPGLNILTGETGAGKSILIGALSLALGIGNFRDYIPEDADYALAELVFTTDSPRALDLLDQEDIPAEDGMIILTRRYRGGRSTSKVNGETVPVSFVRTLAEELIDIYGQHEHQSLLYEKNHLGILDSFAKKETAPKLALIREQHAAYLSAKREWEQACTSDQDRAKELDFLRYEINEIRAAALHPGEDEELESSYRRMANSQKIMEALAAAAVLTGADGAGAADEIGRAARTLSSVRGYDEELEALCSTLADMDSLLADFNRSLSSCMEDMVFDEQELHRVEERLDLINRLKSKYGNSIGEILTACEEREARVEQLLNYESYLDTLRQTYESAKAAFFATARELSEIRRRNAPVLAGKIREELRDLNFPDVQFEIEVTDLPEPGGTGADAVCFRISLNPGVPLRPLDCVASGGELSRIMLAIKTVMAGEDHIETLIFDEIDAGISGRTAQKVSEKMAYLAKTHQILCITHLAQIASMADRHYIIEKKTAENRTATDIHLLTEEESIRELARILGGAKITDTVMENAREMRALALENKAAMKD